MLTPVLPNIARAAGGGRFASVSVRRGPLWLLARIRYQLAGGMLIAVLAPSLARTQFQVELSPNSMNNTLIGTAVAMLLGAYVLRRMLPYPGVQALSFVLPAFAGSYVACISLFLFLRIDYSRFQFVASFALAIGWFVLVSIVEKHYRRPRLAIIPGGNTAGLKRLRQADWCALDRPDGLPANTTGLVADLRSDLDPAWEKFLAENAIRGVPVYHSKHVTESLTGRVEIEHLSENSLGSLLPSSVYLRLKRLVDAGGALIALPGIVVVWAVVAAAIKLEDGGPVLFRQIRMGFRGEPFEILKFRTMKVNAEANGQYYTEENDPRITKVGRFLRRYRIDELPQVVNIIRGEMSWIGPRPESLRLSEAYEVEIPFYRYRHIVRPGITGWAQVQQGWAAEVDAVVGKLHYDFFYIKHFSPWLDGLIIVRTLRTILTGFGAR